MKSNKSNIKLITKFTELIGLYKYQTNWQELDDKGLHIIYGDIIFPIIINILKSENYNLVKNILTFDEIEKLLGTESLKINIELF